MTNKEAINRWAGLFCNLCFTLWGYLMQKGKKSIKRYAKTQNKRTKTCAFRFFFVFLHQKKKQIIN